jgi:hypothetical protein
MNKKSHLLLIQWKLLVSIKHLNYEKMAIVSVGECIVLGGQSVQNHLVVTFVMVERYIKQITILLMQSIYWLMSVKFLR